MAAGPDGTVQFYPAAFADNPGGHDVFTDVLAHETGHLLSFDELGVYDEALANRTGQFEYRGAEWDRWRDATESDGIRSSSYATNDVGEDFAETYRLYLSTRGTPWGHELRALMPERFAILDELTG